MHNEPDKLPSKRHQHPALATFGLYDEKCEETAHGTLAIVPSIFFQRGRDSIKLTAHLCLHQVYF